MLKLEPEKIGNVQFQMLPVEGNMNREPFKMGDEVGDLWKACKPVHKVRVSDFYMGQFPVTQALWRAVAESSSPEFDVLASEKKLEALNPEPSFFEGEDRPVEQVSWLDAQVFIQKLNILTKSSRPAGHVYRLPTEAEWEFAACGGCAAILQNRRTRYAGSDKLKEVGWFDENSHGETKPVGLLAPNELGIFDMSGNVWEWCHDRWDSDFYKKCAAQGVVENPTGPETDGYRVVRGGSWNPVSVGARGCRSAYRFYGGPAYRWYDGGFRLVLSPQSVG